MPPRAVAGYLHVRSHMRTAFKLLAVTILVVCSFFAGAITAGIRHWFQPVIEISVLNDSGQDISEVQVLLETGWQKTTTIFGPINKGEAKTYRLYAAGEGGYVIVATLSDGKKVSGGVDYIESGYSVKETVTASTIKSEVKFYGL